MENEVKEKKAPPVKEFRAGAVKATIWKNSTKAGDSSYNTISLERLYKDSDDKWQSTSSMRTNDIPKAALVLGKSFEWLLLEQEKGEVA
jgi:hypothetical protein